MWTNPIGLVASIGFKLALSGDRLNLKHLGQDLT